MALLSNLTRQGVSKSLTGSGSNGRRAILVGDTTPCDAAERRANDASYEPTTSICGRRYRAVSGADGSGVESAGAEESAADTAIAGSPSPTTMSAIDRKFTSPQPQEESIHGSPARHEAGWRFRARPS